MLACRLVQYHLIAWIWHKLSVSGTLNIEIRSGIDSVLYYMFRRMLFLFGWFLRDYFCEICCFVAILNVFLCVVYLLVHFRMHKKYNSTTVFFLKIQRTKHSKTPENRTTWKPKFSKNRTIFQDPFFSVR